MVKHVSDDQLLSYTTGTLPKSDRQSVRDHLNGCIQCQQKRHLHQSWFDAWETADDAINEHTRFRDGRIANRVMARIEHEPIAPCKSQNQLSTQSERGENAVHPIRKNNPTGDTRMHRRPWLPFIASLAATLVIVFSGGFDQLPTWVSDEQGSWYVAPEYIQEVSVESVQRLQLISNQLYQWLQHLKI